MDRPKLRDVEIVRVRDGLYALRDPLRYTEEILVVQAAALEAITLMDGKRSTLEVQYEFSRRHGVVLTGEKLRRIIDALDDNGFLEGENFEKRRRRIDEEFAAATVRAPAHAGSGYEAEADALKSRLDGYFHEVSGPEDDPAAGNAALPLRGVIAPHIDMRRGSACYARSYAEIKRRNTARTVVLLGIAHSGTRNRFAFTSKDFATPLGTLETDRGSMDRLAAACSFDPFEDEAAHRHEHSLEFQAVFLKHAFPDPADLRIVPVLCGVFLPAFYADGSPVDDPQVSSFISGLRALIVDGGPEILVIAGADLCHIGGRFGSSEPFTQAFVSRARAADLAMLESVTRMDAEGFVKFIQRERDKRNVCGTPAIYALVSALSDRGASGRERLSARLLSHEMAVDEEGESAVGFASFEISGPVP
jgi:AmmeMemoRadiSam system protein B